MSEEDKKNDKAAEKTLGLSKQLGLKKPLESNQVRQSFAHGRSKAVTVEVKKKRSISPDGTKVAEAVKAPVEAVKVPVEAVKAPVETVKAPVEAVKVSTVEVKPAPLTVAPKEASILRKVGGGANRLTSQELDARLRAVQSAMRVEAEEALLAAERKKQQEEEERQEALRKLEQVDVPVIEVEIPLVIDPPVVEKTAASHSHQSSQGFTRSSRHDGSEGSADGRKGRSVSRGSTGPAGRAVAGSANASVSGGAERRDDRRQSHKNLVSKIQDGELGESRSRSMAAMRRAREKGKNRAEQEDIKITRDVIVPETISVQELANRMAVRGVEVIKNLMNMGMMVTINQFIDGDTAEIIVTEFGHKPKRVSDSDVELGLQGEDDGAESLVHRAPVVTIMGHVDHGKTSLLDALRETDVAAKEAGGITQHIGAYQVTLSSGKKISFIDTPGHAAFTDMRARGANVTDIVVLVVAADDGIKEQTVEAIRHAKAANVPIIVAINKIDRPEADPGRVRLELLQHEIVVEEMGGEVLNVEVSAKARTNLDKLEEAILLQAEILDLRANPNRAAHGVVIEAKMEKGRGPVATVLVQKGTLRVGDIFVAGKEFGRVRALVDHHGDRPAFALPSMPVEVIGLDGTPRAGDDFVVVENESKAREIADYRSRIQRDAQIASLHRRTTMDQMLTQIASGVRKELPLIIKADVQGSLEALTGSLEKLVKDAEVSVNLLHAAVGAISESDVTLANASQAIICGFNVRANPQAKEMARRDAVDIRYYSIIYNLLDDVKAALSGLLSPDLKERFLGYAEIRSVFSVTKVGKVAGCMVTDGVIKRGAKVRLLRDNVVIHEGTLKTLKRFKDEVKEVKEGFECGVAFENYNDIREKDVVECFEIEEIARTL